MNEWMNEGVSGVSAQIRDFVHVIICLTADEKFMKIKICDRQEVDSVSDTRQLLWFEKYI